MRRSGYTQCQQWGAAPLPNPVLGAAAQAYEPRTRAASAPGRQPPVRRRGRGASPGAGRGHRPPNPAARPGAKLDPPDHTQPTTQLLTGPRGRTVANIAASGPSDRAAGLWPCAICYMHLGLGAKRFLPFAIRSTPPCGDPGLPDPVGRGEWGRGQTHQPRGFSPHHLFTRPRAPARSPQHRSSTCISQEGAPRP